MDGSAVREIQRLVEKGAQIVEADGKTFTNGDYHILRHKDKAETLGFNNLSSIVPILRNEIENEFSEIPFYIVINDHKNVSVITSLDNEKDRERPYEVQAENCGFTFGRYYCYEDFVIALRSMFVQNDGRDQLLAFLKTVNDIEGVEIGDDGVTQRVTTQSTVSGAKAIPPIQRLAPYRTFSEIMQPESDFLFRVKQGGQFALFEADGGAWKHKARANIAEYYKNEFTDLISEGKVIILS